MGTTLADATDEELWAELRRRALHDTIVSWSGKRHLAKPGGHVSRGGESEAVCSQHTFGKRPNADGKVMWGTESGKRDVELPMCKKCVKQAQR